MKITKKRTKTKKTDGFKLLTKKNLVLVALILFVALSGMVRLYGLKNNLHFDRDEAKQIGVIKSIYQQKNWVSIGPASSAGSKLYHGAYFYYLYLPSVAIGHGSPLAPAIFTILLSLGVIPLLYFGLKDDFSEKIAGATIILYSLSGVIIQYNRWAWNPNAIPFFFALAIFSLAKLKQNPKYLVLFFFAVASIANLHIGSLFLPLIILPLLPFLLKATRSKIIWSFAAIAFFVPFLPTIINEIKFGFELYYGFREILTTPAVANLSFWGHLAKGYAYFASAFTKVTQLDQTVFIITLTAAVALIIAKIKKIREGKSITLPLFLLLALIYLFFASAYYPEQLFLHFAEELFILIPLSSGILLGLLLETPVLILPCVAIFYLFVFNNWAWYKQNIRYGTHQFQTEKRICQIVKKSGEENVQIYVNGERDPVFIAYVCGNFYSVSFGDGRAFAFDTDYRNELEYKSSE